MPAARGVIVSHETVRRWALQFVQEFANRIRRRLARAGDKWHLMWPASGRNTCRTFLTRTAAV